MSDSTDDETNEQMRDEYDFSSAVVGRYADRFREGSNVVILDPDVAAEFRSPEEINEALREQLRRRKASGSR